MDNLSLLSEIVKEQPSILYGDALKLARGNGWLLEVDSHDKSLLKAPAWRVIHQLRVSLIQADREATARELVTSPQFVETGSYKIRRTVIDSVTLKNLITLSDNYHQDSRKAPLSLGSNTDSRKYFNIELVMHILEDVLKFDGINLLGHKTFTVLTSRCFLRRTFPGQFDAVMHGNINNQMWHQDSNSLFNSKPMLTLWIPLQNGSSLTRPGLQLSGLKPNIFNHRFGDSCSESDLKSYYHVENIQSTVPYKLEAGDCLIFNGLTFHQTYLTPSMRFSRDVLLIRVCAKNDSISFPGVLEEYVDLNL